MVRLKNGTKVKTKGKVSFFSQTIHLTRIGFVWNDYLDGRPENEIWLTLFEAKEAVLSVLKANNTRINTWAYRLPHCMPRTEAFYERNYWRHEGVHDDPIHWGSDGGKAVAVRLDSMGCAVEFLSLHDWSNIHDWKLPEGDWHYFSVR